MSTETLDPPVQQTPTQAPVTQQGDLRAMLDSAAQDPHSGDEFKAVPENPDKALEQSTAKPEDKAKPKITQKPTETSQKPSKPKTKWQGIEALKTLETEKEGESVEKPAEQQEQKADVTLEGEAGSPQKIRWDQLRKIEAEYEKITPEYERLQKELADLKGKPQIPEEITQELEHLRQVHAVELLDTKPEFQQEVLAPMQEHLNSLKSVADHAGLDATQRQALRAAAENRDNFSRIRSIKQILGTSTSIEDPEEVQTLVQFALEASGKYQETKRTEERYIRQASDISNSVRGKEAQVTAQEKQAKTAEYETAHKEMIGTLKTPLQALFEDTEYGPELNQSLESIRPAESPMDQAYQAQAGEILPFAVKMINKLTQERNTLRASLKAREAAKPKTSDGTVPVAEQGGQQQPDLKYLLNTMQR